jgi:hypothetical protein
MEKTRFFRTEETKGSRREKCSDIAWHLLPRTPFSNVLCAAWKLLPYTLSILQRTDVQPHSVRWMMCPSKFDARPPRTRRFSSCYGKNFSSRCFLQGQPEGLLTPSARPLVHLEHADILHAFYLGASHTREVPLHTKGYVLTPNALLHGDGTLASW